MKDLCEQCRNDRECPYGQIQFLHKVETAVEEVVEEVEGVDLKPDVKLSVMECNLFSEVKK